MLLVAERKNLLPLLLDQRGLSIYRLAKKMDMPYHNIQKLVNAPNIPEGTEYKTLVKLADILSVKIDDLEVAEN